MDHDPPSVGSKTVGSLAIIRATNPLVWGLPGNAARKLRGFAEVEAESVLEMRAAAALADDAKRRAMYLRHALDEARHARIFSRAATELDGRASWVHPTSDDLFERLGEERFLAFVHRGERRGRIQFEAYRDHFAQRENERLQTVFEGVLDDERRHEAYTWSLLVEVAGDEARARSALRWAARWEAWRTWRRAGRLLSGVVYAVAMMAVYVAIAPLALVMRVVSPARVGWKGPPK